jgi:hypothetical protein
MKGGKNQNVKRITGEMQESQSRQAGGHHCCCFCEDQETAIVCSTAFYAVQEASVGAAAAL